MYSLGRGYEPIDSPYSTPYGTMVLPRIAHWNPVSYCHALWTAPLRLSLSFPHGDLSPSPFLHPSFSLRGRRKLHPGDGYTRMAAASLPTALCIYRYLFTCSRRNNAIPIPPDKCSAIAIKVNEDERKLFQIDLKELKSKRRYLHYMGNQSNSN